MEKVETGGSVRVSIVIVAYNCGDVVEECVVSCLREKQAEIIVIDNASTDSTVDIVSRHAGNQLSLIVNEQNRGFTKACNQGIARAKGEFVFLLNPDARLQPGAVEQLVGYLKSHPDTAIVAPSLYFPDGSFQNYTRRFPSVRGLWVESFVPMRYWNRFKSYRRYTCHNVDFGSDRQVEQPAGAALLFRNRWLLDETYFIYGSDVDLCRTVAGEGYKIMQLSGVGVIHHQSRGGTQNSNLRLYLDLDNYYGMYYYFKKHETASKAFLYKSVFTFSLFMRVLISLFEGSRKLKMRRKKLKLFLQNRNFTAIYE
jgi:GT2 family glycosyltransferase